MRTAILLAGKDLRLRLRDYSAILIAVVVPFALASILGAVFGSGDTPRRFEYAVVDLDRGPVAATFRSHVLDELQRQGIVTIRSVDTAAQAQRLAEDGEIDAAFVLPAGLTQAVSSGDAARLDVIGNVNAPTGAEVARSIAQFFATELGEARVAAVAAGDPTAAERVAATAAPVALAEVDARTKILDVKTYFAAGMAIFFLFFTVQFGVSSLVDERAEGTLRRLLALPLRPWSILAGKLLTSVALGLISTAVLVIATTVVMGADWGDPAGLALLIVSGVLAATGVTSVVASLARSAEQAGSWQSVIATLLGLLGGVFFPIAQVGGLLAAVSLITPHAWFMRGLGELAGGGGVVQVLPAAGAMCAFGLVTGLIAAVRLRRGVLA